MGKYTEIELQRHHQKSGKCENSAKNWPDYVKITPQNSTEYVKCQMYLWESAICKSRIQQITKQINSSYLIDISNNMI